MKLWLFVLACACFFGLNCDFIVDPGPIVNVTQGAVWPKPFQQKSTHTLYSVVRPELMKFKVQNERCDILDAAIIRYKHVIKQMVSIPEILDHSHEDFQNDSCFAGFLDEITIDLKNSCERLPHSRMTEDYTLKVTNSTAHLESRSIWGILRGLESFSQLLFVSPDRSMLRVRATEIYDEPRYSHRGLLVDTSRHYISISTLKLILDGMMYNKLNVFHWHIVDDQSFPYESETFPELSERGAYTPGMVYTQIQIQEIVEYARLRGIRILAEFNTPAHSRSWGVSHPELLTACEGIHTGKLGPIDPTKEETYTFVRRLLSEVISVFPDDYVHLGGNDVEFDCWSTNSHVHDFMKSHNFTKYETLATFYMQRIVDVVKKMSRKSIVWQEVLDNEIKLPVGTVVHVWFGDRQNVLNRITNKGHQVILSSCWMLDELDSGGDWTEFYKCEPSDFAGDGHQKSLVIGGEACMWSDVVDDSNILQRIFPRVSAAAEKLWSQKDAEKAASRLEEHTCRMKSRGIHTQPPNGPGFCPGVPLIDDEIDTDGSSNTATPEKILLLLSILLLKMYC